MPLKWTDTTSYQRGEEHKPTTFGATTRRLRLYVTCAHIYYKGKWVGGAFPLFDTVELKATTREDAQEEVERLVKVWLDTALEQKEK